MRLRILVIAPNHTDLPGVAMEVSEIVAHHDCTLVQGDVRDVDVVRAAADGGYDVIWWATHGSREGVQLSSDVLPISALVQYVIASDAELCVLDTCDSLLPALSVLDDSNADVICTIGQVLDNVAMRTGMLLARALAESETFRQAYEQSRPRAHSQEYLYLVNSRRNADRASDGNGYTLLREYTDASIEAIRQDINAVNERLRVLVLMTFVIGAAEILLALALVYSLLRGP